MCGIVGIIACHAPLDPAVLDRATNSLAHRGPDDSGTVIIRSDSATPVEIGLGNRRLAILDLSPSGHQPMQDAATGNWMVYNGELYNHAELRSRLLTEGAQFSGTSDTEVVLKAYGHWGTRCLAELRGMFALAIWDVSRRRLFLARDPIGIKPLYYAAVRPYFLFASEVRTLMDCGLAPRQLSRQGLLSYLSFGSVSEPFTMIEDVRALAPGHSLSWQDGSTTISRYWRLPERGSAHFEANHQAAVQGVEAAICEAVQMQTTSDVGVGLFLSGGIDSSSLAAILSASGFPLTTFSLVFREGEYNEAEHSLRVANTFKTDHHEILISQQDALRSVPHFLRAMDQPTIDGLNTFLISQRVRATGVKVALSGLGGDEMFAGYSSFRTVPRAAQLGRALPGMPSSIKRLLARVVAAGKDSDKKKKLAAFLEDRENAIHPYFLSRNLFSARERNQLFPAHESGEANLNSRLMQLLQDTQGMDAISQVSYLEMNCYMLNTLLRDTDGMSMAHGLEVRVPLLDHKVAEKLFAMPGAWRVSQSSPKPLLVGATRGRLPASIVQRGKRGFTLPFEHWLRGELRTEVENVLQSAESSPLAEVLDNRSVSEVWRDFLAGETSWSRPWSLYVLMLWCGAHGITT